MTMQLSPIPRVEARLRTIEGDKKQAQEQMRERNSHGSNIVTPPKYQIGDKVWLEGRHLRTNQPTTKLAPRRHGPFAIVQVMSPVNYRLELPTQWSIHDVFHTDLLTPYKETVTHGANYQRPPPELVEDVEEYEVEKVLDSRRQGRGRKLQYLIKWKGYADSDNQWVPWDDVHADEEIRKYKQANPTAETHIKAVSTERDASSNPSHNMSHVPLTIITIDDSPTSTPSPHTTTTTTWTTHSALPSSMSEQQQNETNESNERDLAEARRRFPTPASGRVEDR